MAATDVTRGNGRTDSDHSAGGNHSAVGRTARRLVTETKQAFKTTEFWLTAGVIAMILVSAMLIKGGDTGNGTDEFIARQAWLYVAIVAGAYTIGRGLAKAGSREPYTPDDDR